jgi:hypothetical protein
LASSRAPLPRPNLTDALALAGCDYLVLSAKVMAELEGMPTLQVERGRGVRSSCREGMPARQGAGSAQPRPYNVQAPTMCRPLYCAGRCKQPDTRLGTPLLPQGYNSGFSAAGSTDDEGVPRRLAPGMPAADEDDAARMAPMNEAAFKDGLGLAGSELLAAGVAGLVGDVQSVLPYFGAMAVSAE